MEAKQNADAVERKENPSSRSASTPRPACSVTRRMSSAAAGKPVEESAAKLKSCHEAAEGEGTAGGVGRRRQRGGEGRRQRDGRRSERGPIDRRERGVRRGRGQRRERSRHREGGGRRGADERRASLGEVGPGHGVGAGLEGDGAGHRGGDETGLGGERAGHERAAAEGGRRPSRPGFVWLLGSRLEAKDFMNNWYAAKIINIDDRDNTVLIHFDGWNQRYDEWVKMNSDRLRPLTRHSDRRKKAERGSPKSKPIYKAGENVYARWSDCRMYPAKIVSVNANGSYEVMYEDGVNKTVQSINVDMKPPLCSIGSGVRPAECVGKRTRNASPDLSSIDTSDERLKGNRKLRRCSVTVKRCLSTELSDENNVACQKGTVSVPAEEPYQAAEAEMDEEYIRDDKAVIEHLQQQQQPADDATSDSSPIKRRLIHVKVHGKLKKTLPSPALPVDCKAESEPGTKLKCPHSDCNKEFRNSTLVQYHIKYYHPEDKLNHPPTQLPDKRSFSESATSLHEFPSRKTKRSKTIDCPIIRPGDAEAVGGSLVDQSLPSSSPSPLLLPHSSPSPQVVVVIPKGSFVGRSKANSRRMRHARKKHRSSRTRDRDRSISKKVINCFCEINRETSQLIQCSVCLCWQHLLCLEEEETNLTRRYICRMCTHPPGLRESAKYSFDQDWLVEGRLADYDVSLGGAASAEPAYGLAGKAKIMKITHQLVADLHSVKQVIDSVDRCIFVAQEKVEPEFSHWKMIIKEEETIKAPERAKDVKFGSSDPSFDSKSHEKHELPTSHDANGCALRKDEYEHTGKLECIRDHDKETERHQPCDGESGRSTTEVEKQEKDAEFDGKIDRNSCPVKDATVLNSTAAPFDSLPGSLPLTKSVQSIDGKEATMCSGRKLLNKEDPRNGRTPKVEVNASDDLLEDAEEKETDDEKMDDLSGSATSSADEGEEDTTSCQNHLLHYISQLQDGIEASIAIIEEQVTALESAEGNGNPTEDVLRDLARVKKTMNQMMTDVNKVQQMSFCQ